MIELIFIVSGLSKVKVQFQEIRIFLSILGFGGYTGAPGIYTSPGGIGGYLGSTGSAGGIKKFDTHQLTAIFNVRPSDSVDYSISDLSMAVLNMIHIYIYIYI